MQNTYDYRKGLFIAGTVTLATIALFAVVMSVSEWKTMKRGGAQAGSISVSGEGEVSVVPDIATVTFSVNESAKTVKEAQTLAEAKVSAALKALDSLSIDKKDVKTVSYSVQPKYEYQQIYCITVPCPQGKQNLVGYEVYETIAVKIRAVEKAGDALSLLGKVEITNMSGPDFSIDDRDKVEAEAKEKAIAAAREKAEKTADALGVSLGQVIQFSENGNGYYPMMYAKEAVSSMSGADRGVSVPTGENTIKSNVTVVYSIN